MRERLFNAIYGCDRGLNPDMALERLRRFLGLDRLTHAGFETLLKGMPDIDVARALRAFEDRYPSPDAHLARLAAAG